MSERSKNFLILGGVFGLLEVIFTVVGYKFPSIFFLRDWANTLFLILFFAMVFNKGCGFIEWIKQHYPRMSIYFLYTGWISYFVMLVSFILILSYELIGDDYFYSIPNLEEKMYVAVQWGTLIFFGLFVLSSLYAFYKIIGYKKNVKKLS